MNSGGGMARREWCGVTRGGWRSMGRKCRMRGGDKHGGGIMRMWGEIMKRGWA